MGAQSRRELSSIQCPKSALGAIGALERWQPPNRHADENVVPVRVSPGSAPPDRESCVPLEVTLDIIENLLFLHPEKVLRGRSLGGGGAGGGNPESVWPGSNKELMRVAFEATRGLADILSHRGAREVWPRLDIRTKARLEQREHTGALGVGRYDGASGGAQEVNQCPDARVEFVDERRRLCHLLLRTEEGGAHLFAVVALQRQPLVLPTPQQVLDSVEGLFHRRNLGRLQRLALVGLFRVM
jgi:hypothetical protein